MSDEMVRRKIKSKEQIKMYSPEVTFHAKINEIKQENSSEDLFIEGMASTNDIDRTDDIVEPTAFKKTIKEFMKTNPILLFNHGMSDKGRVGVGKVIEAEIREKGLWVKALVSKAEEELRIKIEEGIYKAFSFGFRILDSHVDKVRGQAIRKITGLELLEISVVSIPANRRALFNVAKAFEYGSDLVYENAFVEKRLSDMESDIKELKEGGVTWSETIVGEKGETTTATSGYVRGCGDDCDCKKVDLIEDAKPAPEETANEIRIRAKDPKLFQPESFRRIPLKRSTPRVFGVVGRLVGKDTTEIQSFRFPKADGWTISKAVQWVKDRKDLDDTNDLIFRGAVELVMGLPNNEEELKRVYLEEEMADDKKVELEEVKAGRVLSTKNRDAITKALSAINDVQASLTEVLGLKEDEDPAPKKDEEVALVSEDDIAAQKAAEEIAEQLLDTISLN